MGLELHYVITYKIGNKNFILLNKYKMIVNSVDSEWSDNFN